GVGSLTGVGITGSFFSIGSCGDVHVMSGRGKLCRIFAVRDFVIVQRESMLQLLPRFEGEVGNPAMVGMVIDEPVSEDGIGTFLLEDALKLLVVLAVNDRMTIDLIGVRRAGFQNLARLFCFGN